MSGSKEGIEGSATGMKNRRTTLGAAVFLEPMKARGTEVVPVGIWQCEIKYDGYRALALINDGKVELWSRTHNEMTANYPEVVKALEKLKCKNAVLDGEIVALDAQGRSRFQLLQGLGLNAERPALAYYVFDVPHLDGESLAGRPLEERRKRLERLMKSATAPVQLSPAFAVEPADLLAAARKQGLEGVIVKAPGSIYEAGVRSGAWLKCKVVAEQEFVIGGFTPPKASRQFFGAILVGYYEGGKLMYAGKVGTGFDRALLESLHGKFMKKQREGCPFANLPLDTRSRFGTGMTRREMAEVTWVKPEFVAQVKFGEWTADGMLRQPVFLGLREDKKAKDVVREAGEVASSGSE